MGGSSYSHDAYTARSTKRAAAGRPVFEHSHHISTGAKEARVHEKMNPRGASRDSRDSEEHPVSVPIAVLMDTTGSMAGVPVTLERRLSALMGTFLDDKASGKRYLGDGYPAIMVGAIDDYNAQVHNRGLDPGGCGALQVGQFESGLEIDEDLERIWLTKNGGGTYEESYELALYFMARHTAHDHWDKRGRKGYLFIIGDEHAYPEVMPTQVENVIGDKLQATIPFEEILREAQERYHVFFVIPKMTFHGEDEELFKWWQARIGQQGTLRLNDPEKVCELIAAAVAICEEHIGIDDIRTDLGAGAGAAVSEALAPLASTAVAGRGEEGVKEYETGAAGEDLPEVAGDPGEIERL